MSVALLATASRLKPALPHPDNPNPEPNPEPSPDEVAGIARLKLIEEQKLLKRLAAGLEREEARTPRHHDHAAVS